jgi:RNA polymerase sigma factor (sigma-70 family)
MQNGQGSLVLRHLRRLATVPPSADLSDRELLESFINSRDEAAFEALVRRHGPVVLRVGRRVLLSPHDAEDVFQATFLVLARQPTSIRKRESIAAWLYGVAYRIARKVRSDVVKSRERLRQRAVSLPEDPLAELTARELCEILDLELSDLPEKCRAAWILCHWEGKARDQAAEQLGISLATLKRRLVRGRTLLQARLQRRGIALSTALSAAALFDTAASAALVPALVITTVQAATAGVAGKSAAILVSPVVAAMTEDALKAVLLNKAKAVSAVLLVVSMLAVGAGTFAIHQLREEPAKAGAAAQSPSGAPQHPRSEAAIAAPRRSDPLGDPLPAGSLLRLGSGRYRGDRFAITAGGKTLATSQAHLVRLLDGAIGKELGRFPGHSYRVDAFAPSPDGKLLATGELNTVYLWDTQAERTIRCLDGSFGHVSSLRFSPDGRHLIMGAHKAWLGGSPSSTLLWDLSTGQRLWSVGGEENDNSSVSPIAFTPDGQALITHDSKGELVLRAAATGKRLGALSPPVRNYPVTASADNSRVAAVGADDGTTHIWELPSGKKLQRLSPGAAAIRALAFSEDGTLLASYGVGEKLIRIWDVAAAKETAQISIGGETIQQLGFALGQTALVYVQWPERLVRVVDLRSGQPVCKTAGHRGQVQAVAYSPDGKTLASGGTDDTIRFWEPLTGTEVRQANARQLYVCSLAFSPDGKRVASAGYNSLELCLWDAVSGVEVRRWKAHGSSVRTVCFSPDGKLLASRCAPMPNQAEQNIKLWDARDGAEVRRFDLQRNNAADGFVAFSVDGKQLLAADGPGTRAWDSDTGREIPGVAGLFHSVRILALAPDGKSMIASPERPGGGPGSPVTPGAALVPPFALWELSTGKERLRFQGIPDHGFNRFVLSPDGRTLAAGGNSSTKVWLWDTGTGRCLGTLDGHDNWIMDLAFSPKGERLASASYDTTVLIWDMASRPHRQAERPLRPEDIDKRWSDLASADAARAYEAIRLLADAPHLSLPLLRERLRPMPAVDSQGNAKLVKDLDSARFADRENAARSLETLGELAVPELEKALQSTTSLEVRRRVERLLDKARGPVLQPDAIRSLRAVEVLDSIGTEEARSVLASLAQGAPEARLTREARASLARLAKRTIVSP